MTKRERWYFNTLYTDAQERQVQVQLTMPLLEDRFGKTYLLTRTGVEKPLETIQDVESPEEAILIMEKQPMFAGGQDSILGFIKKNLQYPEQAKKNNIQGNVYVQFV